MAVGDQASDFSNISLIKSNNVISKNDNFELTSPSYCIVQNASFLLTNIWFISLHTCKIARTVALNNPIAPYVFSRNEDKILSSENLEFEIWRY